MSDPVIDVIIPAWNEEKSIAQVIRSIPQDRVRHIVVCDNNSTDRTGIVARQHGAKVVHAPIKGYGNACLTGMEYLDQLQQPPEILVFIDGDFSDFPGQLPEVVRPIIERDVDMVIGSRTLGRLERGAMQPHQIFGNWLATRLIRFFYDYTFTDLGPFRAIKWDQLKKMEMEDKNFGWTVEMQVKAAKMGLNTTEVAVDYRPRIGKSKVSGTVKGSILAGHKILWTIFKHL